MKRIIPLILAAVLMLTMSACASDEELAAKQAQINELQALINEMQSGAEVKTVYALHATIDGEETAQITGQTQLTAKATLEEGQVVDHWELNGQIQESSGESFTFTAQDNAVVEAVMRAERKITTANCKLRFLNEDGLPKGDALEEFSFEKPYKNPVTKEEVKDGTITVQIKADVPTGYMLDHWVINGVPCNFTNNVTSFIVTDLDQPAHYEAVIREIPTTYYKVTCQSCTAGGKTELWVAAGDTVTVSNGSRNSGIFYVNNEKMHNDYRDSYTVQITGDTLIQFYEI